MRLKLDKLTITFVSSMLFFVACSANTNPSYYPEQDILNFCRYWEFPGYERAVDGNSQRGPFVVRQVRGRIISGFWEGSWETGVVPVLELRGPGPSLKIYEVRGDETGYFWLKDLPQGQYCFFASASRIGWNGAFGIIIIDKKANRKNEIEIVLGMGLPSNVTFKPVS